MIDVQQKRFGHFSGMNGSRDTHLQIWIIQVKRTGIDELQTLMYGLWRN